ncbi:MAG: hypothetical protein WD200_04700 [Candidatus Andersenbacteria bacterium]
MPNPSDGKLLQPDVTELILCENDAYACETYIFEPSPGEQRLGYLFAAAETENRDGIGSELLDTIITAIQKEYFRDKQRSPETSFEMALHQANLILHDTADQGLRDWMRHFHVAIGALAGHNLHLSIAGNGRAFLSRKSNLTDISEGLSQGVITDPLQTFSQVASGEIQPRDTLFLATSAFGEMFRPIDITRLTLDHSATTISGRLGQLYSDQRHTDPLAFVTVALLPQYVVKPASRRSSDEPNIRRAAPPISQEQIKPRQPLVIHRSTFQRILLFIAQLAVTAWKTIQLRLWPLMKKGSVKSGRVMVSASKATGRNIHSLAQRRKKDEQSRSITLRAPHISRDSIRNGIGVAVAYVISIPLRAKYAFTALPRMGKIFGVLSLALVIALVTSLFLLREKRTADEDIQRASELLHEATTKAQAAETALIYDNRDQATGLLGEAQSIVTQLVASGLYEAEVRSLQTDITGQYDRLQRITRTDDSSVRVITDLATITSKQPRVLFATPDALYTIHPETNAIIKINPDGAAQTVHETSEGVGFVTGGVSHPSDKMLIFRTSPAGIATYDTVDGSFTQQEISFSSQQPDIKDIAVYGNRLYVYDAAADQILSYNKTLRGYSSGSAWIEDQSFPKDSIESLAIDGSAYTLHSDGTIRRLFKGVAADFVPEKVEPSLQGSTKIITTESANNIYVIDPANRRVIIFSKKGTLISQLVISSATTVSDIAVSDDETKLYVLDGTRVLEVSLVK